MQVDEGAKKLRTVTNNRPKLNVHAMTYITQGHTACVVSRGSEGMLPQKISFQAPNFFVLQF